MLVELLAQRRQAAMGLGNILYGVGGWFRLHGRSIIFKGHGFILNPSPRVGKAEAANGLYRFSFTHSSHPRQRFPGSMIRVFHLS